MLVCFVVSCCHARDACLFLSQRLCIFSLHFDVFISTPVAFFFLPSLIYLFIFISYERDAFSKFIYLFFLVEKLLYFNGCYSTYCLMMTCKMVKIEVREFLGYWTFT